MVQSHGIIKAFMRVQSAGVPSHFIIKSVLSAPRPLLRWFFAKRYCHRRADYFITVAFTVLLVTMPIAGWIANSAYGAPTPFFGLFTLPKLVADNEALATTLFTLHRWAGFLVILLAGMHIGGALFHYVVRRDNVLQRMLPRGLGGM